MWEVDDRKVFGFEIRHHFLKGCRSVCYVNHRNRNESEKERVERQLDELEARRIFEIGNIEILPKNIHFFSEEDIVYS